MQVYCIDYMLALGLLASSANSLKRQSAVETLTNHTLRHCFAEKLRDGAGEPLS